jgi:hypothetical protein
MRHYISMWHCDSRECAILACDIVTKCAILSIITTMLHAPFCQAPFLHAPKDHPTSGCRSSSTVQWPQLDDLKVFFPPFSLSQRQCGIRTFNLRPSTSTAAPKEHYVLVDTLRFYSQILDLAETFLAFFKRVMQNWHEPKTFVTTSNSFFLVLTVRKLFVHGCGATTLTITTSSIMTLNWAKDVMFSVTTQLIILCFIMLRVILLIVTLLSVVMLSICSVSFCWVSLW